MAAKLFRPDIHKKFYRSKQILWQGIDWLFPPVCAGCGKAPQRFCGKCIQETPKHNPAVCVLCGARLTAEGKTHACPRQEYIDRALVWGLHSGPLREALHKYKYKRDIGLADAFAALLVEVFMAGGEGADLVVPVPLGKQRLKERGYNQAALLAAGVSGQLGVEYRSSAITRIRETRSQVGLSIDQRRENVSGAFKALPGRVSGKRILIIDDVFTTGATLNACAQALKQAGAETVITLTLARAP